MYVWELRGDYIIRSGVVIIIVIAMVTIWGVGMAECYIVYFAVMFQEICVFNDRCHFFKFIIS